MVFKHTCRFSNIHVFSEASSQCFPEVSLNSFTHQHPPREERKMVDLEHTCAPFAFGDLIWKEQICALTEFTDKALCLTKLQGQQKSWFTFNLRKKLFGNVSRDIPHTWLFLTSQPSTWEVELFRISLRRGSNCPRLIFTRSSSEKRCSSSVRWLGTCSNSFSTLRGERKNKSSYKKLLSKYIWRISLFHFSSQPGIIQGKFMQNPTSPSNLRSC